MRVATVVATSYEESPSLPSLSSGLNLARAFYDRLRKPDAGFAVERLQGNRDLPELLEQLLAGLMQPAESTLFYFCGYLVWQPDRAPALALNAARPRAYPLPRLCALLDRFSQEYLVLLDVALAVKDADRQVVADAVCDVFRKQTPRPGGLIGITDRTAINGSNGFTMLVLQSLAQLAQEHAGAAITARALFEHLRLTPSELLGTHALRHVRAARDFVLLPGHSPVSRAPSVPAPSSAVSKPKSVHLEELGARARRLAEQQDWYGLADVYEVMLDHAEHAAAHQIASQLAALCRFELEDPWRAMRALERVVVADGGNAPLRFDLSDLYITTEQLDLAVEHCLAGLAMTPRDASAYRRARWLFERTGQTDKTWNAVSALRHLGLANPDETEVADAHRPSGLLGATATLTEDHWKRCLAAPRRHAALDRVVTIITRAAIAYRFETLVKKRQLFPPNPSLRQDPKTSTTTLCRSLTWTARLLGLSAPELYVIPGDKAEMKAAPARQPTTLVSKAFASGLSLPELAFLWGRHLTYFRPENYLRVFFPTVDDMTSLLFASMLAADSDPAKTASAEPEIARLAAHLHRAIDPNELELLRAATRKFNVASGRARVFGWAESVALGANRAGLVACGDVGIAAEMITRFPIESSGVEQVDDVMVYALSDQYAELRRHLGVAVRG